MITDAKKFPPFVHRVKPWKHQTDAIKQTRQKYYGLFWEMGCGKSKSLLDHIQVLFLEGEIDGALIVSDKGCYRGWEYDHCPRHMPENFPYRLAVYSSSMRKAEERKVEELLVAKDDCLDILCMNVEALASERAQHVASKFLHNHYGLMAVDEATSIKNPKAIRTKVAWALGAMAEYRRVMTGTPITNSPLDLWGICQFLSPGSLGFSSYTAFRSYYGVWHKIDMGPRGSFEKLLGYRCLEQLTASIQSFTSRKLKSECIDLPPKVYERVYVEQTPEQIKAYNEMKNMAVVQLAQGLITSTSALTTLIRLHQINCGHIKMDDVDNVKGSTIDIPSNRINVLVGLLEEMNGKIVIWAHYQRDIELISAALAEKFGRDSYVQYYGETTDKERPVNLKRFREDATCKYWVSTPAAGGKGLNDLVVANKMIYFSTHYNLERRLQSEDRLHRPGQNDKVTIIDMLCRGTVDVKVLEALLSKKDLAHQVLDLFRELLEGL